MGEVLCVTKGDAKRLTEWVDAKQDRYLIWVGAGDVKAHPRIYHTEDSELKFQHIVGQLLYLPFVYDDPAHPALQRLARIQAELHYRSSDFSDQGVKLLANYRASLQKPTRRAIDCQGKFSQFPAIVCGAGPSLKEVTAFLKKHRDQFLILGCGAGMQSLLAAGVQPHLAVHVDPDPSHQFSKTTIPLFFQLRTSHQVASQMKGPRFIMAGSGGFPLEKWVEERLGLEPSSDSGWTATTRGASLAALLGCKQIYFAGVDFSALAASYAGERLMKVALKDGSEVFARPDWLLAAEWLNDWALHQSAQIGSLTSKENPLMPAIPVAHLSSYAGPCGVSALAAEVFSSCAEVSGVEIWREMAASLSQCRALACQFFAHFQTVFPKPPSDDTTCMQILMEINQQEAVKQMIDPIWSHWEIVLGRQPDNHPDSLIIHRLLLLKSLADQFYA
jgi:hypothetical protein